MLRLVYPTEAVNGGADESAAQLKDDIARKSTTISPIQDKTYYVDSVNGNDSNDGKSENNAIQSVSKLNALNVSSGSVVLFKRGSVFRTTESIDLKSGVSYGAYGDLNAAKPQISGSLKNYAEVIWQATSTPNVWKLSENVPGDAGIVTFDGDTAIGVNKSSIDKLNKNGDYYHDYSGTHNFYLYCDVNPSNLAEIEISSTEKGFVGNGTQSSAKICDLSIRYFSKMGMQLSYCKNVEIIGCEFEWIGGGHIANTTRYGNAIELWGTASNISADHCYFNQIYDAAFTFQSDDEDVLFDGISCTYSLIENSSMNFEFWGTSDANGKSTIKNIAFNHNIIRFAGRGFGTQRDSKANQACLLGWNYTYDSNDTLGNFEVKNNIFDASNCSIYWVSNTLPITFAGNSYFQRQSTYTVNHSSDIIAKDQATLEQAISTFDKNAKLVSWIG